MKIPNAPNRKIYGNLMTVLLSFSLVVCLVNNVQALNLTVLDSAGNSVGNTGYRWLVEEDKTYHVQLNPDGTVQTAPDANNGGAIGPVLDPNWRVGDPLRNTLSVSFHRSYMPIVDKGDNTNVGAFAPDPTKYYFISVLPDSGYSMGGASFKGDQTDVTVYVGNHPIPTAQIAVFMHEDIAPINGVWDQGEPPLEGFGIVLEDAGGKYGASAGIQSTDVYGNPLCTTYNPDGSVDVLGAGCVTGADGTVLIKNLAPAKYGIIAVQPPDSTYAQTSTIEGTRLIDAWVKANEPPFFGEFGPPGPHVSIGFAPASADIPYVDTDVLTGGSTISGTVVNLHLSRPPNATFHAGGPFPHTTPWVGLNSAAGGVLGQGLYAARTNDGAFSIPDVPPGQYQLVVWDDNMDIVFGKNTVNIDAAGNCNDLAGCNLGDVGVFQWFTRMENMVYSDLNGNNVADDGEGILEQGVNLRFRDGTIYQAFPTDATGFVPFDQVFPFFSWLVAEVDFLRFKATGVTVTVDDGGAIPFGDPWSFGDQLNPQVQGVPADPDSDIVTATYRHESGPVLTQGFQGFLGQTSMLQWSKDLYGTGENGGISGVVMYAVTRAEDNPEMAAAEPWEPGIPNVTVNLYDTTGTTLLATTTTDSWDDSLPTNCQYGANAGTGTGDDPYVFRGVATDCYDGLRMWNQVRPAVFDGGYAFGPQFDLADYPGGFPSWIAPSADPSVGYMVPGAYVVEVIPPAGYDVIRSQDRNVDFGDEYGPSPLLLPPRCVGPEYEVPAQLALFPGVDAPLAGQFLPGCEQKEVLLSSFQNSAADFSLFTEVPISGHILGFILDDTANEFDPASPQFGEKYAPPFLPVSIRDWTGREIGRTISDENGVYNVLVPSTFTTNLPAPSGMGPNMLTTCMNSKTKTDGTSDPLHNPQYSQFCYTFQYMPGSTTYLDTPVIPVAAFAGPDQHPLDCELPTTTPRLHSVDVATNGAGGGPYLPANADGDVNGNQTITIQSLGMIQVPNPAYDGIGGVEPKTILRDYGFGAAQGTVTLGDTAVNISSWSDAEVVATVSNNTNLGAVGGYQLTVTRGDSNVSTTTGVTVQVGLRPDSNIVAVAAGGSIQDAINSAGTNDLILVGPGSYNEMVIMWKPVQLQGWGEGSTFINAVKTPFEKLAAWRVLAEDLLNQGVVDLIPGQELGFGGIEPDTFFSEEGAGVFVVAEATTFGRLFRRDINRGARIDGFNISGADTGGGVVVNGYAEYLEISNLKVTNNSAFYAGGIRVGHPFVSLNNEHTDAENNFVKIHHNSVVLNGGLDGAGGGIALHTGSDSYAVTNNYVCGNFTTASGAGVAHHGRSHKFNNRSSVPLIAENTVIFNENFNQGAPTNGGGILVAGKLPTIVGTLSAGSGSVEIIGNLIQGNSSGAGAGGGIQLSRVNGTDAWVRSSGNVSTRYTVDIINNIIVNNVAGLTGGGISLQDSLDVNIINNTIAHNDNASTAGDAFSPGVPDQSNPLPGAGVVSHAHLDFNFAPDVNDPGFSDPVMQNNIIWQNRMFYWLLDSTDPANVLTGLCPDIGGDVGLACGATGTAVVYSDLAVTGIAGDLTCNDGCLVTPAGTPEIPDPAFFVAGNYNGNRETTTFLPEVNTSIGAAPALDEGGNFIRLRYGPLTQTRDYHVQPGYAAVIDAATDNGLADDFDLEPRPAGGGFDIGADEVQ